MIVNKSSMPKCHGAVLVELALILPLLIFIMAAVIEFSNILMQDNALSKSVRDSARYISRYGGIVDCNNSIAQSVITTTVPDVGDGDIKIEPICVDTSGNIENKTYTDITDTGVSCGSTSYINTFNNSYCSTGYVLHVRVTASYNYTTQILGLTVPGIGDAIYTPTISAASIMMIP